MNSYYKDQIIYHFLRKSKMSLRYIGQKYFRIDVQDVKRIQQMKNSRSGESCIIIGNGPSVLMKDLDTISDFGIDSFGANAISDIFKKTKWRPTYYSVMDPTFLFSEKSGLTPQGQHDLIMKNGVKLAFYTDVLKKHIRYNNENAYFLNTNYSTLYSKRFFPFSDDISYSINDLGGVTPFNIEIAIYLGYKKIYLYGIDNSYTKYLDTDGVFKINNSIESHVEGINKLDVDEHIYSAPTSIPEAYAIGGFADKRKSDDGYLKCYKYSNDHGVEIINATRGGQLDIFERIDFDSAFERRSAVKQQL